MCESQADGGLRCAAHTRPRYEAASFGTPEWDQAAAEYASTPTGQRSLKDELTNAVARNDTDRVAALRNSLKAGARIKAAAQSTKALTQQHRASKAGKARPQDDPRWVAEMITIIDDAQGVVARGHDVFHDPENRVEIAAARMHIIDLDTAAENLTPEFREAVPEIPWKQLARSRDRNAHHYENIDRVPVWNTIIIDFPNVKDALEAALIAGKVDGLPRG